ncbi:hypothetical protein BDZ91DRAFT_790007 [Kalaharituber pfeilii]|nr:hypothetical protein BDZ91DRAFT_790007 [Kalaharituber pfeilii]
MPKTQNVKTAAGIEMPVEQFLTELLGLTPPMYKMNQFPGEDIANAINAESGVVSSQQTTIQAVAEKTDAYWNGLKKIALENVSADGNRFFAVYHNERQALLDPIIAKLTEKLTAWEKTRKAKMSTTLCKEMRITFANLRSRARFAPETLTKEDKNLFEKLSKTPTVSSRREKRKRKLGRSSNQVNVCPNTRIKLDRLDAYDRAMSIIYSERPINEAKDHLADMVKPALDVVTTTIHQKLSTSTPSAASDRVIAEKSEGKHRPSLDTLSIRNTDTTDQASSNARSLPAENDPEADGLFSEEKPAPQRPEPPLAGKVTAEGLKLSKAQDKCDDDNISWRSFEDWENYLPAEFLHFVEMPEAVDPELRFSLQTPGISDVFEQLGIIPSEGFGQRPTMAERRQQGPEKGSRDPMASEKRHSHRRGQEDQLRRGLLGGRWLKASQYETERGRR